MKGSKTAQKTKPRYLTKALRCPDGTRKYIRGKTQEELDRKVREAQAQLGMGININDNTLVGEFAQIWVDVYKRPKLRPQSMSQILSAINQHVIPYIGHMLLREVKPADCANVVNRMAGLSRGTQAAVITNMRAIFECAVENNLIVRNPVLRSLRPTAGPSDQRIPLTSAQMSTLCDAAISHPDKLLGAFILLGGWAGLRTAEILGLRWENIDLNAGVVYVREQYFSHNGKAGTTTVLKTTTSRRDVPIPPMLIAFLSSMPGEKSGYLYNVNQLSLRSNWFYRLQRMSRVKRDGSVRIEREFKSAPLDFYVHPHLLRHTYATRCIEAGLDPKTVQYLLGHSTSQMTMDIYAHYQAQERQKETALRIAEVFRWSPSATQNVAEA